MHRKYISPSALDEAAVFDPLEVRFHIPVNCRGRLAAGRARLCLNACSPNYVGRRSPFPTREVRPVVMRFPLVACALACLGVHSENTR